MTSIAWILLVIAVSAFATLGNSLLRLGAVSGRGDDNASDPGRAVDPVEDPMDFRQLPRTLLKPAIIGGVAAYGAQQLLWITLLRIADLSFAYPLLVGLNFILIMTVAWSYFKEPVTKWKLAGAGLILAGIITIAVG